MRGSHSWTTLTLRRQVHHRHLHNSHDWQCSLLHMLALELSVDISLRLLFILSTYIRCHKLPVRQVMCKVACTTRVWDSSVTDHLI